MNNLRERITKIIKELGISANIKGYYFIRYAIELLVKDISLINAVTKVLYPTVAEEFKTTPSRVERAIRHAIESGYGKANLELVNKLFGYSVDSEKAKPTNSEFLSTIADYIMLTEKKTRSENNETVTT